MVLGLVRLSFPELLSFPLLTNCLRANAGVKVLKCVEGQYNKAFLLTMDDGMEVFAKIPNPNAGPRFFTTASEVATRHFVSKL